MVKRSALYSRKDTLNGLCRRVTRNPCLSGCLFSRHVAASPLCQNTPLHKIVSVASFRSSPVLRKDVFFLSRDALHGAESGDVRFAFSFLGGGGADSDLPIATN